MVKRVAQSVGNGARPGQEFFVGFGFTGAKTLRNAIGAHCTPFVVVAFEPDFEEIFEFAVCCDFRGGKMRMIVEDGFVLSKLAVKSASGG